MPQPPRARASRGGPREAYLAIQRFLETSRQPVLVEPGEDPLPVSSENHALECRGEAVTLEVWLQVWSDTRNLVRRVRGIHAEQRSRLEVEVERFGGRAGRLTLIDLAHPSNRDAGRHGARLKYRERFRRSLLRQFPGWRVAELSTEPDLQHSLSPCYPRALLRKGSVGLAAIGAAEDALDPDGVLTFGLIWLDHLRRRESRQAGGGPAIGGLAVFLPAGKERTTCHRIRYLDPEVARYVVFVHHPDGQEEPVDPRDYTNFDTHVEPCRQPLAGARMEIAEWVERLAAVAGVERRNQPDGSVSLAVRGLEFARAVGGHLLFGLERRRAIAGAQQIPEVEALARGLAERRCAEMTDHQHPLYARLPEAWLESQVRLYLDRLEATLRPQPLYGQVPQFAAGERGVLDLLAVDHHGRLAVLEVKASQDIHLPLQALDYWMRVCWHLERGEFSGRGYFPGVELRPDPPRLLLVAPALDFHPSNEIVLRHFAPRVEAERVGLGIQWRRELRVMFRRPQHREHRSA